MIQVTLNRPLDSKLKEYMLNEIKSNRGTSRDVLNRVTDTMLHEACYSSSGN
jgi:hypothetical protein